ncbi:MAG: hypothetical protein ACTSPF_11385 [Candidatus Heimdallarchaeaceae archaeon]
MRNSIILSLLITTLSLSFRFSHIEANSLNLDYNEQGMLVPYNNTYLMMSEARVRYEISSTSDLKEYSIEFNANYTIFNPNETISTLIGAPFAIDKISRINNFKVLSNGTEIGYELFHIELDENSTWFEYIDGTRRDIFVSNITLDTNSSLILQYSFDYKLVWKDNNIKYAGADIWYDVGTARAWLGNISETVEFAVYGQQPYNPRCTGRNETGWFEKESVTTEIENGFNYAWFWENERIEENRIELGFPFYEELLNSMDKLIMIIVFPSVGLVALVLISIKVIRTRKITKR